MGEPATRLNNMKLWIWNKLGTNFSSSQLQENFERLDSHKHGPEEGQQIESSGIADGAVTAPKLAAEAVGPSNIRAFSVGTEALMGGGVTREKIAQEAVTSGKLAVGSVGDIAIEEGRALVVTTGHYSTFVAVAAGTVVTPSATRPSTVALRINAEEATPGARIEVYIDETVFLSPECGSEGHGTLTFALNPEQSWKWQNMTGHPLTVEYSALLH
jgi:hypothetical protein